MQLCYHYWYIDHVSTTNLHNAAVLLTLKLTYYSNAVVVAEAEIWPLQLTAAEMQWSMNKASACQKKLIKTGLMQNV